MKSLGLIGPEQTPFYVKEPKLGAPFGSGIKRYCNQSIWTISMLKFTWFQLENDLFEQK